MALMALMVMVGGGDGVRSGVLSVPTAVIGMDESDRVCKRDSLATVPDACFSSPLSATATGVGVGVGV